MRFRAAWFPCIQQGFPGTPSFFNIKPLRESAPSEVFWAFFVYAGLIVIKKCRKLDFPSTSKKLKVGHLAIRVKISRFPLTSPLPKSILITVRNCVPVTPRTVFFCKDTFGAPTSVPTRSGSSIGAFLFLGPLCCPS